MFSLFARGPRLEVGASDLAKLGVGAPRLRLLIDSQIPPRGGHLASHLGYFVVKSPTGGSGWASLPSLLPSRPGHPTTPIADDLGSTRVPTATLLFAGSRRAVTRAGRAIFGAAGNVFAGRSHRQRPALKSLHSAGFGRHPTPQPTALTIASTRRPRRAATPDRANNSKHLWWGRTCGGRGSRSLDPAPHAAFTAPSPCREARHRASSRRG